MSIKDVQVDVDLWEAGEIVALSVALLATGAFLGVSATAGIVLSHYGALEPVPWLDTVATARRWLGGAAMTGFLALLVLEFIDR